MDRGSGDQGPTGSDTGNDQKGANTPAALDKKEATDPNQTGGDDPESGAGYGNHAMPDLPEAGV